MKLREWAAREATRPLAWRKPLTWWKVPRAVRAKTPGWAWFVLVAIMALLLIWWGYGYEIPRAGFIGETIPKPDHLEYRPAKTVWDWLGLLVVPAFLAVAGYAFAHWRETRDRKLETARLREDVLQGYLDRTAELMLDRDLRLSAEDAPVRAVARSRTLLALRRLDGRRKGYLLRFLHESRLITQEKRPTEEHENRPFQWPYHWVRAIIRLDKADLRRAILRRADLTLADLHDVDLRGAILEEAVLYGADLSGANLHGARLRVASIGRFKGPVRPGQDPPGPRADLGGARLEDADLSRATIDDVNLSGANLRRADLRGAFLHFTDLNGTVLAGADLRGANLSGAQNLTEEQLSSARGDAATKLPEGLRRPTSWGDAPAT